MTTVEKFQELAEKYGFEAEQNDFMISLGAKNTDGEWTPWIRYNYHFEEVLICGETDTLNIWLSETRPDMTPEKCVAFVDELNKLFDFHGSDTIIIRDLIDPEDWQEIANVPDASEDERFGKLVNIDGHCCVKVDTWKSGDDTFILGRNFHDHSFYHASVNGRNFFEYFEGPTRETVESDYADRKADLRLDQYETEFGADGRRAFPNLNDEVDDDREFSENWELVAHKEVPDADGFMTEYCWYTDGDVHIFIFGDSEIYYPGNAEPDWECDNEEEAREWFNSYEGIGQDEDLEDGFEDVIPEEFDFEASVEDLSEAVSLDDRIRTAKEKSAASERDEKTSVKADMQI